MRRSVSIILLCIFILSLLTACWDAREIDEWAYIYTIGVDKGVSNQFRITFQIPTMKQAGGGGGGGAGKTGGAGDEAGEKKNYTTISIDAPTYDSGADLADSASSREMNYMHTKFLVISEELAREGVESFINAMVRDRQIRRLMHIIIVRGKASEFVEQFNPVLTSAISKAQDGYMFTYEESGLFMDTSYQNFIRDLKTTYRMPAAPVVAMNDFSNYKASGTPPGEFKSEGDYYAGEIPRSGGNKYEFLGTALFDGDKMVGELNGDETRALLMIRNEFRRASIAMPDPLDKSKRVTIETRLRKAPDIKVDFREGKPVINVKIFLDGDLLGVQAPNEYENVKVKPVLENAFKAYIKGILDKTVDKCKKLNVDVFGFGEKAVMHFLTIQEWESYNWLGKLKDAEVTTEVEFIVRRTGTLLKVNPVRNSEDKKK